MLFRSVASLCVILAFTVAGVSISHLGVANRHENSQVARLNAEAAAQLEQIVKQSPESADAWLLRGVLQLQENTLDAAESSLKRYIELTDRARTGWERGTRWRLRAR